jgi:TRAP-type C4-dicarboxylate transport system permease small subunit
MKQAAVRFLVYLALLGIVFAIFGGPTLGSLRSQLDSTAEHGVSSFVGHVITGLSYLGYYAVAIGFWLIVFELIFRIVRRGRRRERASANEG